MELAATLGAERLREIMTELVNRSTQVVQRLSGTVDKFTGDGVMAVFGAPVALEDHAVRACLAALEIQDEVARLSAEVEHHDGVSLKLRIGLNSGEVITGEIGSRDWATRLWANTSGWPSGWNRWRRRAKWWSANPQRDSYRTSRCSVSRTWCISRDRRAGLCPALDVDGRRARTPRRNDPKLVGRSWELNNISCVLDEAIGGAGCVVNVVGPPGIGKSRMVREAAAFAAGRGVEVFTTYCESHASDIPFHVVAPLLGRASASTVSTPPQPGHTSAPWYLTPIPRICCCWMTCSASRIPTWRYPTSTPAPAGAE